MPLTGSILKKSHPKILHPRNFFTEFGPCSGGLFNHAMVSPAELEPMIRDWFWFYFLKELAVPTNMM